jgi:hypothetical protein
VSVDPFGRLDRPGPGPSGAQARPGRVAHRARPLHREHP